jgi:hypothetical protein
VPSAGGVGDPGAAEDVAFGLLHVIGAALDSLLVSTFAHTINASTAKTRTIANHGARRRLGKGFPCGSVVLPSVISETTASPFSRCRPTLVGPTPADLFRRSWRGMSGIRVVLVTIGRQFRIDSGVNPHFASGIRYCLAAQVDQLELPTG